MERSVDFLNEDEWLAREQRFMQRLQDLRISVGFINGTEYGLYSLGIRKCILHRCQ